jgi:hypothetical protein
MAEWIHISERLPDPMTEVLAVVGDEPAFAYITLAYMHDDGQWIEPFPDGNQRQNVHITQWMPLPPLPDGLA